MGSGKKKGQNARDFDGDEDDSGGYSVRDMLQEAGYLEGYTPQKIGDLERQMREMLRQFDQAERPTPKGPDQFWNEEEEDPEMVIKDGPDEEDPGYDISSMAHGRLDEIREQRHLARIIVWEMPLLSSAFTFLPLLLLSSTLNADAFLQNLQKSLSPPVPSSPSVSATRHTWASSIRPRERSWLSFVLQTLT